MTNSNNRRHRAILQRIARRAMRERGLLPDFSRQVIDELDKISGPATQDKESTRDLTTLFWCSIDNDDSRDLDQLTVAEPMPDGAVKILVAIADVDAVVKKQSALDDHARHNTTSVYTVAETFSMLPEKLSTDLTSLNFESDRLALVIEMVLAGDGSLQRSDLFRATVRNRAKLTYNGVAAWLQGHGSIPPEIARVSGLDENLRLQDRMAQQLKALRHLHGALNLETIQTRPVFDQDELKDLERETTNRAKDIIADFMIAANGVTARYLTANGFPSLRRVLRSPERWQRIVDLASSLDERLPSEPDAGALETFLLKRKHADPLGFPDLSLTIIKLMGRGEYVLNLPGETPQGHFGLAVKAYTHSTAPNRRFPDLITQRLIKAALSGDPVPYREGELTSLAAHCTAKETDAEKVERRLQKSAAALLLESKIGQRFDALVTGASNKGTWVRLLSLPVEGRLVSGFDGLDVGDRVQVDLIGTNVERGFIDFAKAGE
ncbi:MAG: RNB domain-containing ribonuclease [Nitrospirota bacterium]|nr:RNB domain-containing ribonuclease [Nitrospirota bacterium]